MKKDKKISIQQVEKLSELARIKLTDQEKENISETSGPILEMIDSILEVEIDEKDIKRDYRKINVMRDDIIEDRASKNRDNVLKEFPQKQDNYLKTKKIL